MKVAVKAARFVCCHGMYAEEQIVPNHFEVDCAVFFDAQDEELIVDYSRIYFIIKNQMEQPKSTLESLVLLIRDEVKAVYAFANKIEVAVRKMNPPFSCDLDYVEVSESTLY